jgi:hypothetical protein
MKYILIIFCSVFIAACEKDSSPSVNSYTGVYVGNLTQTEGSDKKQSVVSNCRVILTPTGTSGSVTIAADKLFYFTLGGKINGNSLEITSEDVAVMATSKNTLYGSASFSGNSMTVDFKEDAYQISSDFPKGKLYYQTSWKGTLSKQ